ncbi:MAG: SCO family protein [Myxococcota bacterium]
MQPRDIVLVVLVGLALSLGALFALRKMGPADGAAAESFAHQPDKAEALLELWPVPEFTYPDQHGKPVTPQSLRGQVWIANFIFTQCRTVCPLLTSKMVQLQRLLSGVDVRFVSISVDPAHDTPEVLRAYQQKWAPDETRWTLLATDEKTLPATAAGFKISAMKSEGGVDPIIHSAVFVLVDGKGVVRGAFSSEDRADFLALVKAAKKLAGQEAKATPPLAQDGPSLYHQLSCAGCHERPELAPPLGGRAGKRQELTNGQLAVFDEAYVTESILTPQVKMVRGYTLQMPAYDALLDDTRLKALVGYVLAMPGAPEQDDAGTARIEIDPVCHMKVRVTADTPSASFDGGTFYFCAEICRERFTASPQAFVPR